MKQKSLIFAIALAGLATAQNSAPTQTGQSKENGARAAIGALYQVYNDAFKAKDLKKMLTVLAPDVVWVESKRTLDRAALQKKLAADIARADVISMFSNSTSKWKIEDKKASCTSVRVYKALEFANKGNKRRVAYPITSQDTWVRGPKGWLLQRIEITSVLPASARIGQIVSPATKKSVTSGEID